MDVDIILASLIDNIIGCYNHKQTAAGSSAIYVPDPSFQVLVLHTDSLSLTFSS